MDLAQIFNVTLHVPALRTEEIIKARRRAARAALDAAAPAPCSRAARLCESRPRPLSSPPLTPALLLRPLPNPALPHTNPLPHNQRQVLREMAVFEVRDLPGAVEALNTSVGKAIPIKKLLLWVEMARQDAAPGARIPLERWQQVLEDLSS